jgi:hypothetical protein
MNGVIGMTTLLLDRPRRRSANTWTDRTSGDG